MRPSPASRPLFTLPLLLSLLPLASADSRLDGTRLGDAYTSMPLYRSGAGTNVLSVGVGTPQVMMNLTASTNVEFMIVAADGCDECVEDSNVYSTNDSSSVTTTQQALIHTFVYPISSSDTLSIGGTLAQDLFADERGDDQTTRPIELATAVQVNDPSGKMDGVAATLADGSGGFWGLGVYQTKKSNSMIGSMVTVGSDGAPSGSNSFTVGFSINNYSRSAAEQAGDIHWGAAPNGSWTGDFNWLTANRSLGGSWGFELERLRVGSEMIDLSQLYGSIDPGFDQIYVPTSVAERFFSAVPDAERDTVDTTRWNLPCDTNMTVSITISGTTYAISSDELVQARDVAGRTCWGSVVAWQNGSLAETRGEVRLGTPFMSGVYSVLYYSDSVQYVGLAGKPNSVNAQNLARSSESKPNSKLAGILIGTLLGVVIFLFLICYSRNRNSFQSIWYRAVRRQQRAQMNMIVRGATLPPPMMVGPIAPVVPGMMGPMGPIPMRPMGAMGPMGPGSTMAMGMPVMPGGYQPVPPPYQPPIQPQQQPLFPREGNHIAPEGYSQPHQLHQLPAVESPMTGHYSPRLQPTSPPRSAFRFIPRFGRGPRSSTSRAAPSEKQSYAGGTGYANVPLLGESKVRFGPAGARMTRGGSAMSAGGEPDEFGAMGTPASGGAWTRGPEGRDARQAEFIRQYAATAPEPEWPEGYHPQSGLGHQQMYPTVAAVDGAQYHAPNQGPTADGRGGEKKRYFAWRSGGDGKANYGPVGAYTDPGMAGAGAGGYEGDVEHAKQQERPRRSWFGARSGGWKAAEQERDRDQSPLGQWSS